MTYLVIDTCVWLDLAKDPQQQKILGVLDDLIQGKEIELVVPQITMEEFERNKSRIIDETKKSIFGNIKRVKEVFAKFGEQDQKDIMISQLNDLNHKAPLMGEFAAQGSVNWISLLLTASNIIPTTNEVMLKAAQRAVQKRAPFHKNKNSIADAIIIEIYSELISAKRQKGVRFVFVTHNTQDFSDISGNQKLPHDDLKELFSVRKSRYFIDLNEALERISPRQYPDSMEMQEAIYDEPKTFSEIWAMEHELSDKIWYNRHMNRMLAVQIGEIKIVDNSQGALVDSQNEIMKEIYEGAIESGNRMVAKYGLENLGPYSDFEWGMINGKLSALRWVLGDEWDNLDT